MLDSSSLLALLQRNPGQLPPRWLLVGAPADLMLGELPGQVAALTTHYGQWQQGQSRQESWYFGYDDPNCESGWEAVLVVMPKARQELAMALAFAAARTVPGGQILLVGHKKEGIASGGKDFRRQFPQARKWDSARHCQLWGAEVTRSEDFNVRHWLHCGPMTIQDRTLTLCHLPGLFAEGRLDAGTELLLETFSGAAPQGPVLDFACGNGVIGAAMLQRWPTLALTATDVQWQAVTCARSALQGRAEVLVGDGLEPVAGQYGLIVSNPPFHQGVQTEYAVTERFLRSARQHLIRGGELRLVANRFLPWKSAIESTLSPVSVLAENERFHVLQAYRR